MARKVISTALNLSELTLTVHHLESILTDEELVSGLFNATMRKW